MGREKTKAGSTPSLPSAKRAKITSSSQGTSTGRTNNQAKLAASNERGLYNTKFAHIESIEELGVLEGVKKLFDNIGWVELLEWVDFGYKSTTVDFLSSVNLENDGLRFRLFKMDCVLSMDTICQMINAPIEDTFGPIDSTHANFHAEKLWKCITANSEYESNHLKASHIIHPVLRVTMNQKLILKNLQIPGRSIWLALPLLTLSLLVYGLMSTTSVMNSLICELCLATYLFISVRWLAPLPPWVDLNLLHLCHLSRVPHFSPSLEDDAES